MINTLRILPALLLALAVTISLFLLMQFLVAGSGEAPRRGERTLIGDITIPEIAFEVVRVIPRPVEPLVPEELPPLPEFDTISDGPAAPTFDVADTRIDGDIDLGNPVMAPGDADYLPIVRVAPEYPQRAAQREIEGWCLVSFTVDETGAVVDPVVLDAEPPGYFESASLRAVSRFKFNPRLREGQAVRSVGVQYVFTYRLDD